MDENNINDHDSEVTSNFTSTDEVQGAKPHDEDVAQESGSQAQPRGEGPRQETRSSYAPRNGRQGFQRNFGAGGNKRGAFRRPFRKEKYDRIATEKMVIDYKQPDILKRFLTEKGKVLSRYVTGNSAKNQRRLVREVKRARFVGLLPSA